jgi:hypothetical protein
MTQVVQCLPSKCELLSLLNPILLKKKNVEGQLY